MRVYQFRHLGTERYCQIVVLRCGLLRIWYKS